MQGIGAIPRQAAHWPPLASKGPATPGRPPQGRPASVRVDGRADEQRGQEREDVRLQEGDEEFQRLNATAPMMLPGMTEYRTVPPTARMNPTITARTMWPASMLANSRTESTMCRMNRPATSITNIRPHRGGLMNQGTSSLGTMPIQNPTGPIAFIPAIRTAVNVMIARTAVTLRLPVGDAPPGIIPSRLLNRTKKKTVQR